MKIKKISVLFISTLILMSHGNLRGSDSISITYIANCGFFIEMETSKIIVDGLFSRGHNYYPTPDTIAQKLLVSNQPPFNDIDLILVSHTHEDHFDREMVAQCMLNNPSVMLLCPQQVVDRMKEKECEYQRLQARIIECTPDPYTSEQRQVGNIEIYACRLLHPGERHKNVQNIAFLVSVNGKTVFHSADIDPSQIDNYTGVKLSEMDIDIGLINEDFVKMEYAKMAKAFINARYNIAMHLPVPEAESWIESLQDKPGLYTNPMIFTKQFEKEVFYIDRVKK